MTGNGSYLGLDLGTSGLRGLLVDAEGVVIGEADAPCTSQHPHGGWSEQDPAQWISACQSVIAALRRDHPGQMQALRGIGLSGQMHGATLLDKADTVLRPCILWNDTRSAAQAAALDSEPGVRDLSGNIVFPGFTAPKLAWVRENEPEVFARVAKVLLPKDYLRLWLTGEHVSDMSDSAGTSWLDVGSRRWSDRLLTAGGMSKDQMPALVEGSAPSGTLRGDLQRDWGISSPVVVAGGGGDNAAAACGVGCLAPGDGFVSLGTSGVLLLAREGFSPAPKLAVHTFCHAVPDTWYQMGVILAATDSLNWLARITGTSPADLANGLDAGLTGPSRVRFLPYLSGERTPHNDSAIRGAFVGLDVAHGVHDLTAAVMEGVAFALRDSLEALKSTGPKPESLLAIGGGARSRFWLETLATVLGVPLDLPQRGEFGAALGAARLAIVADGGGTVAEVMTKPAVAETIVPEVALSDRYEDAYAHYRALYPALKAVQ